MLSERDLAVMFALDPLTVFESRSGEHFFLEFMQAQNEMQRFCPTNSAKEKLLAPVTMSVA